MKKILQLCLVFTLASSHFLSAVIGNDKAYSKNFSLTLEEIFLQKYHTLFNSIRSSNKHQRFNRICPEYLKNAFCCHSSYECFIDMLNSDISVFIHNQDFLTELLKIILKNDESYAFMALIAHPAFNINDKFDALKHWPVIDCYFSSLSKDQKQDSCCYHLWRLSVVFNDALAWTNTVLYSPGEHSFLGNRAGQGFLYNHLSFF